MSLRQRTSAGFIVLAWLLMTVVPRPVTGQAGFDEIGLQLTPAIIELVGEAGTTASAQFAIDNISSAVQGVTVDSRSLLPNDPEIDQAKRYLYDAASWVVPIQTDLLLTPDEQAVVDVQFVVPPDASAGGHYALVTFTPVIAAQAESAKVPAQPEISAVVLFTVPGDIQEVAEATAEVQRWHLNRSTVELGSIFSNTGNVHLLPQIQANIRRSDGEFIESISLQPQLSLPNTAKPIAIEWEPGSRFGRFTVDFEYRFGTPQQTLTVGSATFLVLPPIGMLAFGLFSLVLLVFVLRFAIKKLFARRKKHYVLHRRSRRKRKPASKPTLIPAKSLDAVAKTTKLADTPRRRPAGHTKTAASAKKRPTKIKVTHHSD